MKMRIDMVFLFVGGLVFWFFAIYGFVCFIKGVL